MSHQNETAEFLPPTGAVPEAADPGRIVVDVEFGAASNRGKVRTNNEDHYAIVRRTRSREILMTNVDTQGKIFPDDHAYTMIVADGVGGRGFGERASELVLRIGWELAGSQPSWIMKYDPKRWPRLRERVETFAGEIQNALVDYAEEHPKTAGMGTTWTCAYTMGPHAVIAHAGDSRAYLFHDGKLRQLTRDHTLARELEEAGMPAEETIRFKHLLTNSFGAHNETVEIEVSHEPLADRDRMLLCSDGLTDMLSDDEIAEILKTIGYPQAACDALIDLALAHGGKDNVTVVLGDFYCSRQAPT